MNRKAAIELSVNFMVVIILGIVILSMGIYLTVRAVSNANKISEKLDKQTEQQLYALLDDGNPVVAPLNTAIVQRKQSHIFGVGVRNMEHESDFKVIVEGVNVDDCDASVTSNIKFLLQKVDGNYQTPITHLLPYEENVFSIVVQVAPTAKSPCEYVINARVMRCTSTENPACGNPTELYYTMQKLYVSVP